MAGLSDRPILGTPIAVVDLETTGLSPTGDRIIEIAVVRVEPNQEPALVLETLVNPRRPVAATEIHGITDADVADAPYFRDIAGNLLAAISGCVFAAYNVYFDAKFAQSELAEVGVDRFPPCLCLMYLRPMLGLGSKCSLTDACLSYGLEYASAHRAAADAMASARLWQIYSSNLESLGVRTFDQLAALKPYKFTNSFKENLLDVSLWASFRPTARLKPRGAAFVPTVTSPAPSDRQELIAEYWDALTAALADLEITGDEVRYLLAKRRALQLTEDELRWLHSRAYVGILADTCADKRVTAAEVSMLHRVTSALREIGWAPGDALEAATGLRGLMRRWAEHS